MLLLKGVEVPVIFLTSNTSAEMESQVLGAGAADFIRKPVDPTILASRVRNAIGWRSHRQPQPLSFSGSDT